MKAWLRHPHGGVGTQEADHHARFQGGDRAEARSDVVVSPVLMRDAQNREPGRLKMPTSAWVEPAPHHGTRLALSL